MTLDPFLRFALIVLCGLYVLGLVLVQRWLGWWPAFGAFAGGGVLAAALSIDIEPDNREARERRLWRLRHRPERIRELRRRGEL